MDEHSNFKLSLRLGHPTLRMAEIERGLGLKPTAGWNVGGAGRIGGNNNPVPDANRGHTNFCADLPREEGAWLDESLEKWFDYLDERRWFLRLLLDSGGRGAIGMYLPIDRSFGFRLDSGIVQDCAKLGLGLPFDTYGPNCGKPMD